MSKGSRRGGAGIKAFLAEVRRCRIERLDVVEARTRLVNWIAGLDAADLREVLTELAHSYLHTSYRSGVELYDRRDALRAAGATGEPAGHLLRGEVIYVPDGPPVPLGAATDEQLEARIAELERPWRRRVAQPLMPG